MINTAFLDVIMDEPVSSHYGLGIGIVLAVIVVVAAVIIIRKIKKNKNQ